MTLGKALCCSQPRIFSYTVNVLVRIKLENVYKDLERHLA